MREYLKQAVWQVFEDEKEDSDSSTQYPVSKNGKEEAETWESKKKKNKNRDPKSAATSNFILIVVVMVTLTKHSEVIFKLLRNFFEGNRLKIYSTEVSKSSLLLWTNIYCT